MIGGLAEAAQDVSPEETMRLQRELGNVSAARSRCRRGFRLADRGAPGGQWQRADREHRALRHCIKAARATKNSPRRRSSIGCGHSLPRSKARTCFSRQRRISPWADRLRRAPASNTRCKTPISPELVAWSQKLLDKLQTLGEIADVSTDLLANAPHIKVITINRDQAARFGINASGDRRHAQRRLYGQRPDHPIFHPAGHLLGHHVLKFSAPICSKASTSLERIYVKSPLTGLGGATVRAGRHRL